MQSHVRGSYKTRYDKKNVDAVITLAQEKQWKFDKACEEYHAQVCGFCCYPAFFALVVVHLLSFILFSFVVLCF
jgi:hypothetical protein